jgi:hypothetical protein
MRYEEMPSFFCELNVFPPSVLMNRPPSVPNIMAGSPLIVANAAA